MKIEFAESAPKGQSIHRFKPGDVLVGPDGSVLLIARFFTGVVSRYVLDLNTNQFFPKTMLGLLQCCWSNGKQPSHWKVPNRRG